MLGCWPKRRAGAVRAQRAARRGAQRGRAVPRAAKMQVHHPSRELCPEIPAPPQKKRGDADLSAG